VKYALLVALVAVTAAAGAYADDTVPDDPITIREGDRLGKIHVEGNRRTREGVILDLVEIEEGDPVTAALVQEITEEIIDSDIFAEVRVTLSVAAASTSEQELPATQRRIDLNIEVREKWTLIPIPFFSTDGDSFNGGLIVIESNLLGRNKQLITAAFGGSGGFSGFFAFVDPSIAGSRWRGRLSAGTRRDDTVHALPDGTTIREYQIQETNFSTGIGYRFSRDIGGDAGVRVAIRDISSFEGGVDPDRPASGTVIEPNIRLGYDSTRPRGVLRLGPELSGSARLATGEGAGDDLGWEVTAQSGLGVPFARTLQGRLRFLASGGYGEMPATARTSIAGRDGYRTLPQQQTVADRWGSVAAYVELPVVRRSWGALVLSHYWEGGLFDDDVHDQTFFGGPGGGFRVFLQEVAIPAVGLDFAYNMVDPGVVFSFTVGARM
jgi:hypothetical protein